MATARTAPEQLDAALAQDWNVTGAVQHPSRSTKSFDGSNEWDRLSAEIAAAHRNGEQSRKRKT